MPWIRIPKTSGVRPYTIDMYKIVALFGFFSLLACSNNPSPNKAPVSDHRDTNKLTGEAMIINQGHSSGSGADLRLSFTGVRDLAKSRAFTIQSNYDQKNIGFTLYVPKKGYAPGRIESTGQASNNFLIILQQLYKQKPDSARIFIDSLTFDCISLGDIYNKDSMGTASQTLIAADYKIFMESKDEKNFAELFLNVNEAAHWIELKEKDEEYRAAIIDFLSKKRN